MAIRLKDLPHSTSGSPTRRMFGLSPTALKWIGLGLTCIASLGVAVFQRGLLGIDDLSTTDALANALMEDAGNGWINYASTVVSCGLIATLAIPIYGKLVYEAWKACESRLGLMLRLLLCALIAEIPYDFAMTGQVLDLSAQNPAWALLLCVVMLEVIRIQRSTSKILGGFLRGVVVVAALVWALLLRIHLGTMFVLLAALFYFTEGNPMLSSMGGAMLTIPQFPAPLGMVLAHFYEASEKKSRFDGLFYALYPLQLLIFGLIGMYLRTK